MSRVLGNKTKCLSRYAKDMMAIRDNQEWFKKDKLPELVAHLVVELQKAGYDTNLQTLSTGTGILVWEKERK